MLKTISISAALLLAFTTGAGAISVTNLDKQAHVLLVDDGANKFERNLAPNETYHREGADITIQLKNRTPIHTMPGDSYSIWPGPYMSIQKPGRVRRDGSH